MTDLNLNALPLRLRRLPAYGVHDGARVQVCSEELADLFGGTSPAEMVGRDAIAFVAPEAQDQSIAALITAQSHPYRSVGVRLDGTTFPIEVAARAIRFRGGEGRLFTVRDLSPVALVVDDEEPVAKMTATLMRRSGFQTVTYTRPRQALAEYEPGAASVLVSDIVMPDLDGVQLVEHIRRLDPDLPVVFVSGYSDEPVPQDAATILIAKPFGISALERAIAALPSRARLPLA